MNSGASVDPTAILVLFGIWAVVGIAFYVWYLWSLARLFPRIGLPASHGWIPIWNQWQLVGRAGLPGWLVLFALVPGLGIIALVVMIIAINRINNEYGKGAGFTVLGAIIPQIWAMLLAGHIDQTGHGAVRHGSAHPGAVPPQAYAPPGYAAPAPQFSPSPQPQAYAPQVQAPPAAAPAVQPAAPQPAAPQSNIDALFGAPTPRQDLPPVPPQAPSAPSVQPQAPVAPHSGAVRITPVPPAPGSAPTEPAAAQPQPGQSSQPAQPGAWGFSNTTEDAFERLAAQGAGPQAETPLGYVEPPRPFSWPEQHSPVEPDPAVPVAPATPAAAVPPATPEPPAVPVPSAAPVPPATPVPPAAPEPQPITDNAPSIFSTGEPAAQRAGDAAIAASATAPEVHAPPAAPASDDDDDDRTVVVSRRRRWGLELPSGDVEELVGDDVVIGRRPEGPEGVTLLKIADPTRTLSKSHVRMRRVDDEWTIEDLQSTNGVSVDDGNGVRVIEPGREVRASEHMVIGTLEVRLREIK